MQKKRIIILDHNRGRLANQLWNFISLYAYSLERGFALENYSFFEYANLFTIPKPKSILIRLLFFSRLRTYRWYRRLRLYDHYISLLKKLRPAQILADDTIHQFYLPPSPHGSEIENEQLKNQESTNRPTYTLGWLFRNPLGLQKYHKEIIAYFRPHESVMQAVESYVSPLRAKYRHVIGVHIRQTDYATWMDGRYFFSQQEVRTLLDGFLSAHAYPAEEVVFVVCSDGRIEADCFQGLTIVTPLGSGVADLFTLARTDLIIGSDSTYGAFAAYYGNIPFIVFDRAGIDWSMYQDKKSFFENPKSTFVFY